MIEALIAFTITMLLGTVSYQLGRRDGREEQKRAGIEIESEVWFRGLRGEVTGYSMSGGIYGDGITGSFEWKEKK